MRGPVAQHEPRIRPYGSRGDTAGAVAGVRPSHMTAKQGRASPGNTGAQGPLVPTPADTKNRREQLNPNNKKYRGSRGGS